MAPLKDVIRGVSRSTRPLSTSGSGPAQIGVDKDGDTLVVTEKTTNQIALYAIGDAGELTGPVTFKSNGAEPFGFAFDRGMLLVSEAFGGSPNTAALSSYEIGDDDGGPSLEVISGSVPTNQTAACWTVVARLGRYAYVTNTGFWNVVPFGRTQTTVHERRDRDYGGKANRCCNQPARRHALCLVYIHRQDHLV